MTAFAALGPFASPLAQASTGTRVFEVKRGGGDFGRHTLSVSAGGGSVEMEIAIDLRVRVLGLTAFRYTHRNRETWSGGRLVEMNSTTNDDGEEEFCRVSAQGDTLSIDGSGYRGEAPADAAPSTYWNYASFNASRWFSSQSGKLFNVRFERQSDPIGERIDVVGDFKTTLFYDGQNEWRGCEFDAGGTPARYIQTAPGPLFNPLV